MKLVIVLPAALLSLAVLGAELPRSGDEFPDQPPWSLMDESGAPSLTLEQAMDRRAIPSLSIEVGDVLLDKAFAAPGNWDQMCSGPRPIDPKVPLPIYRLIVHRMFYLSAENLAQLREQRAAVVPALALRIATLDFTKPPVPRKPSRVEFPPRADFDPRHYNSLVLDIVLGLNAIETLPALLQAEAQLAGLLDQAEADSSAPLPQMPLEGALFEMPRKMKPKNEKFAQREREVALLNARVAQRELLSAMLMLLRAERFPALLESDFEKRYADAIKKRAREKDLKDIKKPEDVPADQREWLRFDPIYHVPLGSLRDGPSASFTPQLRAQIRGLAKQFLQTVPPEQWKAGSAMPVP